MFPVDLGKRNEHILSRGARMLLRGQGDINPHVHGISKATAQPRLEQQYNSTTSASSSGLSDTQGAYVYMCACSTGDIYASPQSTHLFPRTIKKKKQTHVVEPNSATVYTAVLVINWDF